jgi:hypothetical protein
MKRQDWTRGYFCAVANRIKGDGQADQLSTELFKAGGDWRQADPEDIAVFELHGLIRSASNNELKATDAP